MENLGLRNLYKGKKVFVTGHTGFKGSWLCQSLLQMGADVCGYALEAPTKPALFDLLNLKQEMKSVIGDIRNLETLNKVIKEYQPDIVFHLAAQPIVLTSYENPVLTYETNVMGTVYLLEAVRNCDNVKSVINITTDKVYQNNEWYWGYREVDRLNGYDPYSNSKSCSELVTDSYKKSFFKEKEVLVSTVRAGNVIGGGDFADNRIIPDAYRAACYNTVLELRSPYSIRPYQHVLEAIWIYLYLAVKQLEDKELEGSYNVGPNESNCVSTLEIAERFCKEWGHVKFTISNQAQKKHEANYLKLDCSKLKSKTGWNQIWDIEQTIKKTVELYQCIAQEGNIKQVLLEQIGTYEKLFYAIMF